MTKFNIEKLQENVHLITNDKAKIFLLGTAHVSRNSAELVQQFIREQSPDRICIELCDPRFQSIQDENSWKNTDIFEVIRSGKAYVLMAQLVLASFQKRIAKEFGIRPGEEMRVAISEAQSLGKEIVLIDREVRTTLKRSWAKAKFFTALKLLGTMFLSAFSSQKVSEEEIEAIKEGDVLQAMVSEFGQLLPGIKEVLIDERDMYMASKLGELRDGTAVAVVGAGHVPGMLKHFGQEIDLAELESIPPASPVWKILGWGLPLSILALLVYGFCTAGAEIGTEMAVRWILATGIGAGIGAALALPHPLTILSAIIAAPITTLHPTLAAGWVSGLLEAWIRKPKVSDLESVGDDMATISGIWGNQVSKILLVIAFTNIGASIGMYVGTVMLASLLG